MVASGSRLLWSLLWFVGAASSDDAFGRKQGAAAALADAVPEADRYPRSQYPQYPRLQSLASLRPVRGKAVFLQIYTGPLLLSWPLTMASCRANPDFQWITLHLGPLAPEPNLLWDVNWAPNYHLVQATPREVQRWVQETLGLEVTVSLANPNKWHKTHLVKPKGTRVNGYKWNEYKAFYGHMFSKWIKDCEFWGYGDMDVVYGNIGAIYPDSYRKRYDVLSDEGACRLIGPWSLFRNIPRLARYAMTDHCAYETNYEWKALLTDLKYHNYDEVGFHNCLIAKPKGQPRFALNTCGVTGEDGAKLPDRALQCEPMQASDHCAWRGGRVNRFMDQADRPAMPQAVSSEKGQYLYIHFHAAKHRIERSLRGKSRGYIEALVRDGWYVHSYKHCRKGCGALPWPASQAE